MSLFLYALRINNSQQRSSNFKALTSITSSAILTAYIAPMLEVRARSTENEKNQLHKIP